MGFKIITTLQQTISAMKSPVFSQHRQSIEEMFKPIKASLATSQEGEVPCMTEQQQDWYKHTSNNLMPFKRLNI